MSSRRLLLIAALGLLILMIGGPGGGWAATATVQTASAQTTTGQSSAATQESDSPINDQGSSFHYRSYIDTINPKVPGLNLEVLEFADRLALTNHTGKTVTINGYGGEPYARVQANGTVEVNMSSPAYYLNQSFYGDVTVPASASASAPPHWTVVDRTGRFEWHDHRIHWMSPVLPPQVKNRAKRTKIFNWRVPIQVGTSKGAVNGQLFWTPEASSNTPVAAIVAFVVILLAGLALVVTVRRRRARPPAGEPQAASKAAW
jgi:hypothetical protein